MLESYTISEGTCYTTKDWRDQILFWTTQNSYYLLYTADRIKYGQEIYDRYANGEHNVSETMKLEADVLGTIKIMTATENYMKAVVLDNDFVIHKIIKEKAENLFKLQKKEPVSIEQIFEAESLTLPLASNYIFETLSNQTINFSLILNSPKYSAMFNFNPDIIDFLNDLNNKRNSLHYLTVVSSKFSNGINEKYLNLKEILTDELITINEKLGKKMKLSDKSFLSTIHKTAGN